MSEADLDSSRGLGPIAMLCAGVIFSAASGCGVADAGRPDPGDVGAIDVISGDTDTDADTGAADGGDDTGAIDDTFDAEDASDRKSAGEPCQEGIECQGGVCLRIVAGLDEGFCSSYCFDDGQCQASATDEWSCVFLLNSGGDAAFLCVPETL